MNSVKILHCADIHIGAAESSIGALSESRRAETLITFEKIINLAKENSVDVLLIAGKGAENYQEILGVKHEFNDKSFVEQYLKERG